MSRAIVTRKEQPLLSPHRLIVVQLTVVVPRMNMPPEGGLHVMVGDVEQLPPVTMGGG